MKILIICQYYYPEQFRINDISETLVSKGHEVTVLTGLPNYPNGKVSKKYRFFKKRKEIIKGVHIIRCFEIGRGKNSIKLGLNYLSYMLSASFKALFLRKDFDVIFSYQLSPVLMVIPAIIYKKRTKKKLLLYCLDIWPESLIAKTKIRESLFYKLMLKISNSIYKSANFIFTSSNTYEKYIAETNEVSPCNIKTLYQYEIENNENNADSVQAFIDSDKVNIVYAGNIGEIQRIDIVVQAAKKISSKNIVWHIIGDGVQKKFCERLTKKLNIKNIIFYGQKSLRFVKQFYNHADALLLTSSNKGSLHYAMPGKIQSYLMAGKPIIGSISGEAALLIIKNKCGLCCKPEDVNALAFIINDFVENIEAYRELGANGYNLYQDKFAKKHFFEVLLEKLQELV